MKSLDIIICVKPVPDPKKWDKLKLDPETMLLRRGDIPAVINSLDRNAIELAVGLKEKFGGTATSITMAPVASEEQIREALAMGCDHAFLLCDKAFAGADTLATARCLEAAIRKIGRFDLILCGGFSLDGSTAQVGPQLAELLGIPDMTHAIKLEVERESLKTECKVVHGTAVYESKFPAVVTLDREINVPRLPSMVGIMQSRTKNITIWGLKDLGLSEDLVGLKGSPTQMLNVFTPSTGRKGDIIEGPPSEIAKKLIDKLKAEKISIQACGN